MDDIDMLKQWYDGIRVSCIRHRIAKTRYVNLHRWLSIMVVVLTLVVSMTLLVSMSGMSTELQIAVVVVSMFAARN